MTDARPHPWKRNLVVHGGPFGGIPLPPDVIITTDQDLLDYGLIRGHAPWQVKEPESLLVLQLGYARESNVMLAGMIWEIVLARRDAYRAATWIMISEDPALDPHYALDWRTKKTIACWQHTHLWGDGDLRCTLPKVRGAVPDEDPVDAAIAEQIEAAGEYMALSR